MALALVLVGAASLSAGEAQACGGGGSNEALALLGIGVVTGTVVGYAGFTFLDLAARGEGHGTGYGLGEALFGGAYTLLFASLTPRDARISTSQELTFACLTAWSAALLAHGIYTMAVPRVEPVAKAAAPPMALSPVIFAERDKQAYGVSLGATF